MSPGKPLHSSWPKNDTVHDSPHPCGFLFVTATLKLWTGYPSNSLLAEPVYFAVAGLEIGLGILLLMRRARMAALVGITALAAAGIGVALLFGDSVNCGCLGAHWSISQRTHMMMAGTLGVLSVICIMANTGSRRTTST